jgi:hypothetical protein
VATAEKKRRIDNTAKNTFDWKNAPHVRPKYAVQAPRIKKNERVPASKKAAAINLEWIWPLISCSTA